MDYEKKYKEALERAREIHNEHRAQCFDVMVKVFPELKESEDEKIRKAIIEHFRNHQKNGEKTFANLQVSDFISWLEKQGNQPNKVSIWKHWKDGIAGSGDGEQIYLIKIGNTYNLSSCLNSECDYIKLSELDSLMLKKQGEQKPADKIEPKFKVGDWVVTSYGKVNKVIAVDKDGDGFTLDDDTYFSGSWKDDYHLWTIQDAKDGDVFVAEIDEEPNDFIYIFKEYGQNLGFWSHCYLDAYTNKFHKGIYHNNLNVGVPATKEQRDMFFQKMHEAGYEWDANKLELKKKMHTFKPFDKVLVRANKDCKWAPRFFAIMKDDVYCDTNGSWAKYCIPYEGNEHLLGTTENCE